MNKERLLKLADFIETVPEERFDMGAWKCGTVACALGWACTVPEFNAAGLTMITCVPFDIPAPSFGEVFGFNAGSLFFGISIDETYRLFDPDKYRDQDDCDCPVSKSEVSARIRELVAHEDAKADADLKTENP